MCRKKYGNSVLNRRILCALVPFILLWIWSRQGCRRDGNWGKAHSHGPGWRPNRSSISVRILLDSRVFLFNFIRPLVYLWIVLWSILSIAGIKPHFASRRFLLSV